MNIFAVSGLINAVTVLVLGGFVYLKNQSSEINRRYALFCFCVAFWSFAYFLWQIAQDARTALFFSRALMAGAIFIPICFLHFVLILLELIKQKKKILNFGYFIFSVFFILNFTPYFVENVTPKLSFSFWPKAGIAFGPFLAIWLWYCLYPCVLLFRAHRRSGGSKRNQIQYVLLAIAIGYAGGSTNYFLWYGIPIVPYGNLVIPLFVGIMAYAIVKHHLMDINVIIRRSAIYSMTIGILAAGYILLVIAFQAAFQFFGGYKGPISWTATALAALIIALTFETLKEKVTLLIDRTFYRDKYDYRQALKDFSRLLTDNLSLEEISWHIVRTVNAAIKVENITLFLLGLGGQFQVKASLGSSKDEHSKPGLGEASPLVRHFSITDDVLIKKELSNPKSESVGLECGKISCEAALPLISQRRLIGILSLGAKISEDEYSQEDLRFLSTLVNQAVVALDNCRLYKIIAEWGNA